MATWRACGDHGCSGSTWLPLRLSSHAVPWCCAWEPRGDHLGTASRWEQRGERVGTNRSHVGTATEPPEGRVGTTWGPRPGPRGKHDRRDHVGKTLESCYHLVVPKRSPRGSRGVHTVIPCDSHAVPVWVSGRTRFTRRRRVGNMRELGRTAWEPHVSRGDQLWTTAGPRRKHVGAVREAHDSH